MRDTKPAIPPQQAPSEKKTFKRRRCQNCNKLYMPSREDQKFCRDLPDPDKCRKEFYRYGSSYGPLKTGLHKAIDKKYAALEASIKQRFFEAHNRIARIEGENRTMRALLQKALDRFEDHSHEYDKALTYDWSTASTGKPL